MQEESTVNGAIGDLLEIALRRVRDTPLEPVYVEDGILSSSGLTARGVESRSVLATGVFLEQRYRTPDLVSYLTGGPPPTPKSDVFQLGLVLAELFTGQNPQKAMAKGGYRSPIELDDLIDQPHPLWGAARAALESMLIRKPEDRQAAELLLATWQDIYEAALKAEVEN